MKNLAILHWKATLKSVKTKRNQNVDRIVFIVLVYEVKNLENLKVHMEWSKGITS